MNSLLILLYLTAIGVTIAVVNALIDAYQIKKKWGLIPHLNYQSRSIIRFCIFFIACILVVSSLTGLLLSLTYVCSIFWLLFDLTLNYLRKKPLLYTGQGSWLDRTSTLFDPHQILAIKITAVVEFACLVYLI